MYNVVAFKKKHGVQKEVSMEDNFQMAYIQPECHSTNFTNEYYLSIRVDYDSSL